MLETCRANILKMVCAKCFIWYICEQFCQNSSFPFFDVHFLSVLSRFGNVFCSRRCTRSFNLESQMFSDRILRVYLQTIWKDVKMMQLQLNQEHGQLASIHKCISVVRKDSKGPLWRIWFDWVLSSFLINFSSSFGVVVKLDDD